MIQRAKSRARKKGWDFDLSVEDILPLPRTCPILGLELISAIGGRDPRSYSLDRIDNSRGYVRGNVQVISQRANLLKSDATPEELEAILAFIR